ncbi:MAG: DNA polymerase, partial [Candidatus Promineifilaceae bacterium]
ELPPSRYQREPQIFNPEKVVEKMHVRPEQIVDLKALMGDTSDNIPGVKGVGAKTAERLLSEYGTLDGIYEHIDEVKGAMQRKLIEGKDDAYLSYKLARIVTDAPIELDIEACVTQEFDRGVVVELFRELEFRSLTNRILETTDEAVPISEQPPTMTKIVQSKDQLAALIAEMEKAEAISFDVETTGLDERTAELVGICLAVQSPVGCYIPVGHLAVEGQADDGQMTLFAGEKQLAPGQLSLESVVSALKPVLENSSIPKIAHNAKYDYAILQRYGIDVTPIGFDTMIAEWLTDPASKHLGLKDLSFHRLGIEQTEITTLIGKGKDQISFASVPIEQAAPYGAADADITLRLAKSLEPELKEKGLESLMQDIEMPLIKVLASMEREGVGVDVEFFKKMSAELEERINVLEGHIYELAGGPFNINSTQQLSDVLFVKLGLPHEGLRKTKSGHYSTAADVLAGLQPNDRSGIIDSIIEYRELNKLKNTYVDALPKMVNKKTGRIHTSYHQTGAITGRLASSSPNLQ